MATVINNPGTAEGSSESSTGLILGIVLAIIVIGLFIVYGLPALRGTSNAGTTVNVPEQIDVNVQPNQ